MFQVAFAIAVAKRLTTRLCFDGMGAPNVLNDFFEIPYRLRSHNNLSIRLQRKFFSHRLVSHSDRPCEVMKQLKRFRYYDGFFQCPDYFESAHSEIKQAFRITSKAEQRFLHKYTWLSDRPYTAVHIRRTDFLNHSDYLLPMQYFERALEIRKHPEHPVIFVSDDIAFVEEHFGRRENYYFEANDAVVDFQIIQNAQHSIISNSTFAWWAAYLRSNRDSTVHAPLNWFGYNRGVEHPPGIMRTNFNWQS